MRTSFRVLSVAAALTVFAVPAVQAQILSPAAAVSLSATKVEVLTLSLGGVTSLTNTDLVASNIVGGLTATMGWSLSPSRGNVNLVGWFSSTVAMSDAASPANEIAVGDFLGACTSSGLTGATCSATPGAFTGTDANVGVAGASRVLWTSPAITGATRNQTTVAVGLSFSVASTRVASLPAGTYAGTLNLRAYAQ